MASQHEKIRRALAALLAKTTRWLERQRKKTGSNLQWVRPRTPGTKDPSKRDLHRAKARKARLEHKYLPDRERMRRRLEAALDRLEKKRKRAVVKDLE